MISYKERGMWRMAAKRTGNANLKAAQVIMDALGVIKSEPQELAIMITRAIRADSIANTDDYTNQCGFIKDLITRG